MASTDDIKIRITAEDKASGVLAKIGDNVGGLSGVLGSLAKVGLAGAVAGVGALTAIGISSVKAFTEQENAVAQLDAVLKSTHNAAGLYKEDLLDQASALQKVTTFGDEAIIQGQNLLLTFTNLKGPIVQEATQAILDVSTAMGQDLSSSAIQVGKALNNPIEGISALTRIGVTFNDQQKEQIKTLVESGKTMEAQQIILHELGTEFGGSATAAAQTFTGKIAVLKNSIGEMQESIGSAIVTAITPFITQLSDWAAKPETQQKIQQITAAIISFGQQLQPIIQQALPALITVFGAALKAGLAFGKFLFQDIPNFVGNAVAQFILIKGQIDDFIMRVENAIRKVKELISTTAANVGNALLPGNPFGKKQFGGQVVANKSFLVGERGPELFTPGVNGAITPNNQLGGGGAIIFNITGTFLSEDAAEAMANKMIDLLKLEVRM